MTVPANEGGQNEIVDQGLGLMPQDQDQSQQQPAQGQQEEVRLNPAWNGLLSRVPQGLHNQILPELKQWDQNYQQGIQKVHSQYAAYKPFLEQQIDPDALNEGYLIRQALENDPMAVVQAMIQHYQLQLPTEQGQPNPDDSTDEDEALYDVTQHPEFQRMQQMVELMGQNTIMSAQAQQDAQADADLDSLITQAQQKHGEFDEDWILQKLYFSGVDEPTEQDLDNAVAAYHEHVNGIVQNYRSPSQNAPVIMGGGGGLPSQQTPVGSMTGKDRRALIVQTLMNQAQSGQ